MKNAYTEVWVHKHYHFVFIQRASKNHPAQGLHRTWFQHCGRWRRGRHFRVFHPRRWASGSQWRTAARRSNLICKCSCWAFLTTCFILFYVYTARDTQRSLSRFHVLKSELQTIYSWVFWIFCPWVLGHLLLVSLALSWEWDFYLQYGDTTGRT